MAGNWQDSWWVGCAAEVVVAGGCGDDDFVWSAVEAAVDEGEVPAGHFSNLVAAFALTASIGEGGESAVGVSSDVVEVPDGCVAEGVAAGLVA